jgi:single-stranded-DNA-specific exonuclease
LASPLKQWHLKPHDAAAAQALARSANISPVVAGLLLNRGIREASEARLFLDAPMMALHSPALMPNIDAACDRILAAIRDRKPICIYGDYDVDGTTGTAILLAQLTRLQAKVQFHVPLRLEEGYGLNCERIRTLAEEGVGLIVSVDCGISSLKEAELARELGVELIITDHHQMKDELPNADVLVHPRLPDSRYPFDGLSGSCVAFKLAWALAQRISGSDRVTPEWREFLQDAMGLAALGLVADVVPLRNENRVFVRHGLQRLVSRPSCGIQALVDAAKLTDRKLKAEDVSFKLAPRLNAAGRLGCARLVVELLTTASPVKAREIADFLELQNSQRQSLERKIVRDAKQMVEDAGYHLEPGIVMGSLDWHAGVVGIVAGRLAEAYARPVLLAALQPNDEPSTGSGRSVPGFALHEALQACDAHLLGHGGHAAAAGFKVRPSQLDALRHAFVEHVRNAHPEGLPPPRLNLDSEVPLAALTFSLMKEIDLLEPYGSENPRPRFLASGLQIVGEPKRMGATEAHLGFQVRQGNGQNIRAVGFGMGERASELMSAGGACSLAFTPKINEWNGRRSVEMEIIDFRPGPTVELV